MGKYMTIGQLKKAMERNRYLILINGQGIRMGHNSKVAKIILNRKDYKMTAETNFIGFQPCSFQEYLSTKIPFTK